MQVGFQPLQQRCGIALLPVRASCNLNSTFRPATAKNAPFSPRVLVHCSSSDSHKQQSSVSAAQSTAGALLAAVLTIGNLTASGSALAKPAPLKKSDPYEVIVAFVTFLGIHKPCPPCANIGKSAECS